MNPTLLFIEKFLKFLAPLTSDPICNVLSNVSRKLFKEDQKLPCHFFKLKKSVELFMISSTYPGCHLFNPSGFIIRPRFSCFVKRLTKTINYQIDTTCDPSTVTRSRGPLNPFRSHHQTLIVLLYCQPSHKYNSKQSKHAVHCYSLTRSIEHFPASSSDYGPHHLLNII